MDIRTPWTNTSEAFSSLRGNQSWIDLVTRNNTLLINFAALMEGHNGSYIPLEAQEVLAQIQMNQQKAGEVSVSNVRIVEFLLARGLEGHHEQFAKQVNGNGHKPQVILSKQKQLAAADGYADGPASRIIAWAEAHGGEFATAALRQDRTSGINPKSVQSAVAGLIRRGIVKKLDRGRYRLTDAAAAPRHRGRPAGNPENWGPATHKLVTYAEAHGGILKSGEFQRTEKVTAGSFFGSAKTLVRAGILRLTARGVYKLIKPVEATSPSPADPPAPPPPPLPLPKVEAEPMEGVTEAGPPANKQALLDFAASHGGILALAAFRADHYARGGKDAYVRAEAYTDARRLTEAGTLIKTGPGMYRLSAKGKKLASA